MFTITLSVKYNGAAIFDKFSSLCSSIFSFLYLEKININKIIKDF